MIFDLSGSTVRHLSIGTIVRPDKGTVMRIKIVNEYKGTLGRTCHVLGLQDTVLSAQIFTGAQSSHLLGNQQLRLILYVEIMTITKGETLAWEL